VPERFMRLRFLARQRKRGNEILIRSRIVWTDLKRAAGPFDGLIVLLQGEMTARLVRVPCSSKGIAGTEPNRPLT
jgi:hypothetical protein